MAAYVCIGSNQWSCARARARAWRSQRAGGCGGLRAWGAPGAGCQAQQKGESAPHAGGCAGSSPLPPALHPEHAASDSQQRPFASAPELSSPSLPRLHGRARPDPGLPAVTHPHSPEGQMGTSDGRQLCSLLLLEHPWKAALTSCQTGASHSLCKVLLYLKTEQQGHLLNSHLQLVAGCILLPPFTPSPRAETPQGWHPNRRSTLSWLASPCSLEDESRPVPSTPSSV